MIQVLCGRKSKSAAMLQDKLTALAPELEGWVRWGNQGDGINGMRKLSGPEQLDKIAAAGVVVPNHSPSPVLGYVGRDLYHTQGRDIALPHQRQYSNKEWYVEWVKSFQEWRIHIFNGRSIARGVKHYVGDKELEYEIRSRRRGWRLRHDIDPPEAVREAARKAVLALGYVFGAVDVLVRDPDDVPVVLEVNSAPGLDNYTATKYAEAIVRYVKRQRRTANV